VGALPKALARRGHRVMVIFSLFPRKVRVISCRNCISSSAFLRMEKATTDCSECNSVSVTGSRMFNDICLRPQVVAPRYSNYAEAWETGVRRIYSVAGQVAPSPF
jgi:hypothetical protein